MPIDMDYVCAESALKSLDTTLSKVRHGDREQIADEYEAFAQKMKEKYDKPEWTEDE